MGKHHFPIPRLRLYPTLPAGWIINDLPGPEGATRIDVRLADETFWLSQAQLDELLQTDRTSITKHIRNIYESGELDET